MADAAGRLSVRPDRVGAGAPEAARRRRAGLSLAFKRGLAIAALFGGWELLTGGFGGVIRPAVNPALFPPPSLAIADLVAYARSGLLLTDMTITLGAAFAGLFLGTVGGLLLGLLLGYWRSVADVVEPILVAFNSLPRVALAPVLIIWLGLGISSKIFLSLFTVFFIVFFNTYLGVRSVDPDLVKAIKVMGGTRGQIARMVVMPSVFSWIFAALRTSVSFALTGAVVGEFVGSTAGLGYRMNIASGLLNTPRVFGILLLLMVIGVILVELAKRVELRLLRWRPPTLLQ
ncbi:MAG: ABC transporter permease [Chloroflexi bacterium]|nr:ABC transporter permease [Chloroflexota bacterium]